MRSRLFGGEHSSRKSDALAALGGASAPGERERRVAMARLRCLQMAQQHASPLKPAAKRGGQSSRARGTHPDVAKQSSSRNETQALGRSPSPRRFRYAESILLIVWQCNHTTLHPSHLPQEQVQQRPRARGDSQVQQSQRGAVRRPIDPPKSARGRAATHRSTKASEEHRPRAQMDP